MAQSKNATDAPVRINNENSHLRASDMSSGAMDETRPERLSDEVLIIQVTRGSSDALEALYDRYAPTVLGICLKVVGDRALAEDLLQETFWRVWKSAETYQSERGTFTGWLFRIARNLAIDAYRRRNVRPQALETEEGSDPILEEAPDPDMDVAEQAQSILRNRQVRKALASLPQVQRQVIEMAYFYGMTRQEIAEATGEALGTIHTRARLGLQKLREELDREEFEG
jgi:RNA polymerase sigma-70 factor (ECF subfamily)